MPRILLLLPTRTYRAADFLAAAQKLDIEVTVASEEPSAMERMNPEGLLTLDFHDPEEAASRAAAFARRRPFHAVLGVDDDTEVSAAAIAEALGLPHNSRGSASAARHKPTLRGLLAAAGVPVPRWVLHRLDDDPAAAAAAAPFPCVLKPTFLAASRGVIRANGPDAFVAAWDRIRRILEEPETAKRGGPAALEILVEEFISGKEVALEGLLARGRLRVLALFDKPDPLDGPFFEETIYVTPSRLPLSVQREIGVVAAAAAGALGLTEGPFHAELRLSGEGPVVIEAAARSIGGLCSRTLRFGTGMSLEELILRHALGMPEADTREDAAAGVLMIPIPRAGVFAGVRGLEAAAAVPFIVEATITLRPGQPLVPLPEASRYLGFLFSRAARPEDAERALRVAHAKLEILTDPER